MYMEDTSPITTDKQREGDAKVGSPAVSNIRRRLQATVFFCLGTGHVLLYNFLISSGKVVHDKKFPGKNWLVYVPAVKTPLLLLGFIVSILFIAKLSFTVAVLGSYVVMALSVATFTMGVFYSSYTSQDIGYAIALTSLAVNSFFAAISRTKTLAVACKEDSLYAWAEQQGLGFAGLFSSYLNVLIVLITGGDEKGVLRATLVCYILCSVWQLLCGFAWKMLSRMYNETATITEKQLTHSESLLTNMDIEAKSESQKGLRKRTSTFEKMEIHDTDLKKQHWLEKRHRIFTILWLSKLNLVNLCFPLCITMMVFPAIVLQWNASKYFTVNWYSLYLVCLYNTSDFIGRYVARWRIQIMPLLYLNLSRILLLPIIGIIYHYSETAVLRTTTFRSIVLILFAASNGYVFGVATYWAPSALSTAEDKSQLAPWIGLFLLIGVTIGAYTSVIICKIWMS